MIQPKTEVGIPLPKWTAQIKKELTRAGFEVSEFEGFPLVKIPKKQEESVRLLRFSTSLAANRRILDDSVVFLPGMGEARKS